MEALGRCNVSRGLGNPIFHETRCGGDRFFLLPDSETQKGIGGAPLRQRALCENVAADQTDTDGRPAKAIASSLSS
jgi:hypothetical protein